MHAQMNRFLQEIGMHYTQIDLKSSCDAFLEEMHRGLIGETSTLKMLPTFLQLGDKIPMGKEIVVMDAGGTNFRAATVCFAPQGPVVQNFQTAPMPGIQGRLTKLAFFDAIAKLLLPIADKSSIIGFCFSFPTEIQPNQDGRILSLSKEVAVDNIEGAMIGEEMNRALEQYGIAPKRWIVLNDAAATLLGGLAHTKRTVYGSYIGYILGTGTNTCYLEQCKRIVKSPAACNCSGEMAVNIESGGFGKLTQGLSDQDLDRTTDFPGEMLLEKMVSGYYQGKVIYHTARRAADASLFSQHFTQGLEKIEGFSLRDVNAFCERFDGNNPLAQLCATPNDQAALDTIICTSFERAARLTVINLGAILLKTNTGTIPACPVCVTAEGTVFDQSKRLREKLNRYVHTFLNDTLDRFCVFQTIERPTLIGTAVAALLNQ